MNKVVVIIGIVIIVVAGLWLLNNGDDTETNNQNSNNEVVETMDNYIDIKQEIQAGEAILLDVRTPQEYAEGHASEATNLSLQSIEAGALPEVDKAKKVYVYCRTGNRSEQAASILRSSGYKDVVNLGGLEDVADMGAQLVN